MTINPFVVDVKHPYVRSSLYYLDPRRALQPPAGPNYLRPLRISSGNYSVVIANCLRRGTILSIFSLSYYVTFHDTSAI
jgi:hypothetical protein